MSGRSPKLLLQDVCAPGQTLSLFTFPFSGGMLVREEIKSIVERILRMHSIHYVIDEDRGWFSSGYVVTIYCERDPEASIYAVQKVVDALLRRART